MFLKTKVFSGAGGYKKYHNSFIPVCDVIVNLYLFGFLIHSVTIHDMDPDVARKLYKDKIVHFKEKE